MSGEKRTDRKKRETLLKRNATIAGMTVPQYKKFCDVQRLRNWTKHRRQDPVYRKQCAERQRARQQQLVADAEFGRMARAFLDNLGRMLGELANLRDFAMNGEAQNGKTKKEVV